MRKIATHKFFDSYMKKTWLDEHIWLVSQYIDCSQSPIFPWDRRDIVRLTVNGGHLDFHDTHPTEDGNPQRIALDLDDLTGK